MAASHTVHPGESIQAAVDAAAPGDTIRVLPGDYTETHPGNIAVHVTKAVRLLAKSKLKQGIRVRLIAGVGQNHGIVVEPANPGDPDIDGIRIEGFTVQGFPNNGIWLKHTNHFQIQGNESVANLENGIWPTLSANGLVKRNLSYGSEDSALWIEASENVRVVDNELHSSPTGLEVTVSNNILITRNDVHDNTTGVGLYHPSAAGLPPLQPLDLNGFWRVVDNHVHDNNAENTAPPGSMSEGLPPGGGILVLGVDNVDVRRNLIENNDFYGISMIDWCLAQDCVANPPEVTDTAPDSNHVIANTLKNNGTNPTTDPDFAAFAPYAADLTYLVLANQTNCYKSNTYATFQSLGTFPSGQPQNIYTCN